MKKRGDILVALLSLADIIVLVVMYPLLTTRTVESVVIYVFDTFIVSVMAFGFYRRMRKSQLTGRRYILNNWYEIPSMIPIVVFAAARSFTTHDDIIVLGIMFRALGVLYLLRLFDFVKDNLRIFGGNKTLHVFVVFFMALTITAFFFYAVEHTDPNSQINTMADALWWTIQTMSTATYGPNPATSGGRIIGSVTMIIGVGVTGVFISTLAAGLTKLRTTQTRGNQLGYETKQTIKSKIDGLEKLSDADVQVLLSMIESLHGSLKKSKSNL